MDFEPTVREDTKEAIEIKGSDAKPSREEAVKIFKKFLKDGVVSTKEGGCHHGYPPYGPGRDTLNLSCVVDKLEYTEAYAWGRLGNSQYYGWVYVISPRLVSNYSDKLIAKGAKVNEFLQRGERLWGIKDDQPELVSIKSKPHRKFQPHEVRFGEEDEKPVIPREFVYGIIPSHKTETDLMDEFKRLAQEAGVEINWIARPRSSPSQPGAESSLALGGVKLEEVDGSWIMDDGQDAAKSSPVGDVGDGDYGLRIMDYGKRKILSPAHNPSSIIHNPLHFSPAKSRSSPTQPDA